MAGLLRDRRGDGEERAVSPEQLEQQARSHRAQMAIYGDWQIVLSYSPRARDGIGKWWRHEPTGKVPRSRVPDDLDLPPLPIGTG